MRLPGNRTLITTFALLAVALPVTIYIVSARSGSPRPAAPLSHAAFEKESSKLSKLLNEKGVDAAFSYVDGKLAGDVSFARSCHPLLHHLGREAYTKYGGFEPAMAQAREVCNSGYVHGVIEEHFIQSPSTEAAIVTSCSNPDNFQFKDWECFHGIGHGIMQRSGRQTAPSLDTCRTLMSEKAVAACANGVFMEAFIAVGHDGAMRVDEEVPGLELCQNIGSRYKTDCYNYAPTGYLGLHDNAYSDALTWCNAAEKTYVQTCQDGVASEAMKENMAQPEVAAGVCRKMARSWQAHCVASATGMYIFQSGSSDAAKPLCPADFKAYAAACWAAIDYQHSTLGV